MVTMRVNIFGDENPVAMMLPVVDGVTMTLENYDADEIMYGDWDRSSIYINMNAMNSYNTPALEAIIIHELGHSLKLSHNREYDGYNQTWQPYYKSTFPASMHSRINVESGTNYEDAQSGFISWILTNFDKAAFRYKWGD